LPERFVFRQVDYRDVGTFLADGEIRAKNHPNPQRCHQTSYQAIVNRRGTSQFPMPCGGVVNDYVPFYFSPLTSFTYTIHRGNVPLKAPDGTDMGIASDGERAFIICRIDSLKGCGLDICYSDFPLNSNVPIPTVIEDLDELEQHVYWDVFEDAPKTGRIPEIGYEGVCKYFKNVEEPPKWQYRSQKRMAEFLVKKALPLEFVCCIVAKTPEMQDKLQEMTDASTWEIPILLKPDCYF